MSSAIGVGGVGGVGDSRSVCKRRWAVLAMLLKSNAPAG